MKLKNTDLNFYEVTRLSKDICDNVVKKLEQSIVKWKTDELTYITFMAQYDYFTPDQLKKLVMHLSKQEVSKRL